MFLTKVDIDIYEKSINDITWHRLPDHNRLFLFI